MTRHAFPLSRSSTVFTWKIVCRSGILSFGFRADFLLTLVIARREKARWASALPSSTIRVQLLYPNRQRVSKQDIRAALNALDDARLCASVFARMAASEGVPPAAQARTERTADAVKDIDGGAVPLFRQAGVVAPPDSLTGETSTVPDFVELSA